MSRRALRAGRLAGVACGLAALVLGSARAADGQSALLRFPDIHRDFVVFVHAGDVWRAPTEGGFARQLTSHPGQELFPKISPDGAWVAFSAEYTGSRQVFVVPAEGGPSRQLTYYNDVGAMPPRGGWDNWVLDWTADGKILVRMNRTPWSVRMGRYFLVDPAGGLERPLELPEGGGASYSPDGRRLAYCPVDREFRTWKRHRGGRAQDIWIYDFGARRSTRLTSSPATENFPIWAGEEAIYFTSDREPTLNLYVHDLATGNERRLTDFAEFDVLWPAGGPGSLVFMNGGQLWTLELATERSRPIPIEIAADLPNLAPRFVEVAKNIQDATIAPDGARAVFASRGDLFSVPAEHGSTRNLTRSPGVRERDPAWSPDGELVAFVSDASGEYEIWLGRADGTGEPRRLTEGGRSWRYAPVWSPDSAHLAFGDRDRTLWLVRVADGKLTEVDRSEREDLTYYTFSPDSRWLAYEKSYPTRIEGVFAYSLDSGESMPVGDGTARDFEPVFSADGRHLFFLSNRDFNLTFSDFEFDYVYTRATRVYAMSLDPDAEPLFPPRSDEAAVRTDDETPDEAVDDAAGKSKGARRTMALAPDGFLAGTVALPGLSPDRYAELAAAEDAVYYLRGGDADKPGDLFRYDLAKRKEEKVLGGVDSWRLAAGGKKLLYRSKETWGIAEAKAGLADGAGKLDLSGLRVKVDPREEWRQIYRDALRITRDWFYDPSMHGKDWSAIGARYEKLLPGVAHRGELDFLLGELISELDAGHTYVEAADEPKLPRVEGGMLGAELEAHPSGYYRLAKIYRGENWDAAWRSPLTEPGVRVAEGSFLLAIDGEPLRTEDNPYRLLEGKGGSQVRLTVNDRPQEDGARQVTVVPISSEANLRYLDWVRGRMDLAARLSDGRVGYIHLPDTSTAGNRALQKFFYSQVNKPALVVDDRYNGGGFIPDRMIEYFGRRTIAWWGRRGIDSMRTPNFAHDGPKAMLINAYSSSGGDALPYFFREAGLGPLVGTRTWGGLIGLSGNPRFVDGGAVLIPTFRIYDRQGRWIIENVGVEPDVEVVDLPEARIAGGDPSLERAIGLLLEALEREGFTHPPMPTPPDLSP